MKAITKAHKKEQKIDKIGVATYQFTLGLFKNAVA
jgi:hypothetical protein